MTALLASSSATGSTATEGDVKTYLANLRTFMADLLGTDSANKAAVQGLLGNILNGKVAKTAAYTVVAADRGKVIDCTGTWTLSIATAATLGDGFSFALRNSGSGAVTIDPNLSELINGLTSFVIGGGEFVIVYCDGAGFSTVGGASAPVGSVSAHAASSIPVGWLECNGAAISRNSYASLFNAIGTAYGPGDGSTTFNVPDLRGEFIRGFDNGRGVDISRTRGSAQSSAVSSHAHALPLASSAYAVNTVGGAALIDADGSSGLVVGSFNLGAYQQPSNTGANIATTAAGGNETRPRNVSMYYIIKT